MIDFTEMLATIEENRAALIALQTTGNPSAYVIMCGPMCIRVVGAATSACGVTLATQYTDKARAQRIAARIRNGANEVARAVRLSDALTEELASNEAALGAIRGAMEKQAQA